MLRPSHGIPTMSTIREPFEHGVVSKIAAPPKLVEEK